MTTNFPLEDLRASVAQSTGGIIELQNAPHFYARLLRVALGFLLIALPNLRDVIISSLLKWLESPDGDMLVGKRSMGIS